MSDTHTKRRFFGYVTKSGRFVRPEIFNTYAEKQSNQLRTGDESLAGALIMPPHSPTSLAQLLEHNTYHYRACRTKARDTAGLGWLLDSDKAQDASQEQRARLDAFFAGLSTPITITLERAQLDYEAIGYAAIEVVRQDHAPDGEPVDLVHIPAKTLKLHRDGKRIVQERGMKRRWFKHYGVDDDVDDNTGAISEPGSLDAERRATEIIWWINYTPNSEHYGLPDIIPALGALLGDLSRRDYNIAFFDNYGVPAYAVVISGDFDEGEIDEDGQSEIEKAIAGHFEELSKNPHSILVMGIPTRPGVTEGEVKIEFKPLAVEVEEASFRLYRQDNRDEILAAHGVPPYRMGISETGSLGGSTARETTEIYKRSVIEPRQSIIEDLITRHIIHDGFEITDWRFKLSEIDTTDEAHDLAMQEGLTRIGAMTAREVREQWAERFGLDMDAPLPAETGPDFLAIEAALEALKRTAEVAMRHEAEPEDAPRAARVAGEGRQR